MAAINVLLGPVVVAPRHVCVCCLGIARRRMLRALRALRSERLARLAPRPPLRLRRPLPQPASVGLGERNLMRRSTVACSRYGSLRAPARRGLRPLRRWPVLLRLCLLHLLHPSGRCLVVGPTARLRRWRWLGGGGTRRRWPRSRRRRRRVGRLGHGARFRGSFLLPLREEGLQLGLFGRELLCRRRRRRRRRQRHSRRTRCCGRWCRCSRTTAPSDSTRSSFGLRWVVSDGGELAVVRTDCGCGGASCRGMLLS